MNKNEINVLDELNKGACMGRDATYLVMDKVSDINLKNELQLEYDKYCEIIDEIAKIYPKYSEEKPHQTSFFDKAMTWYGIEIRTIINDSTSKIAELFLKGTNMGIIEGRKLLNHKDTDKCVEKLVKKYVDIMEESIERLKAFL